MPSLDERKYDSHSNAFVNDTIHIARDAGSGVRGFEITLGQEQVTAFLPFTSIAASMPADDRRLLAQNPERFLARYGKVMISTARERFRGGALGTPDDLERFEATERMRKDAEDLSPEQAAVLAALRTTDGGAKA